ncbi:MAG: amidohydrolase family protein, partial [Spirochaetes bacterium]|nr:amidohydrolase family protein [Spirochaetota bacterium]
CGTLLPYMFSEGYMRGRISLQRLVEVTSEGAARRYGLFKRKGSIEAGKDADLVLMDPVKSWIVKGKEFYSKGKITPFEGMELKGLIVKTILRGKVIYTAEEGIKVEGGYGRLVKKEAG